MSHDVVTTHGEYGFAAIDWQHYSHQNMWDMIMAADPATMFEEAERANELANVMGGITTLLQAIAQNVVGAWSGATAESAATQIHQFLQWSDDTANVVTGVARQLNTYAHILNRARFTIPAPDGTAASRTHAQHVMEHYAIQSQEVSEQLSQYRFTRPPGVTALPLPAPEPTQPPYVPPHPPTTHPQPPSTLTSSATTTPSSVAAVPASGTPAMGAGVPGLPGGATSGVVAGGPIPGPGSMSGIGAMAAAAEEMAPLATAAEEAGWNGFAPMPPPVRTGDRDGEHRDRYSRHPDLIGELPPAFPPVLGL